MKRFLRYCLLFFFPLIIIAILMECMLRVIPNDYGYKKQYVEKHGDSLEVLFLGNSHAYYGIDPALIRYRSFNMAAVAQSIDLDWQVLKASQSHLHHLKVLAVPLSYASMNLRLVRTPEAFRLKNYNIYYGIDVGSKPMYYSELLSFSLSENLQRLFSYCVNNSGNLYCDQLGRGTKYDTAHKDELWKSARDALITHNYDNPGDAALLLQSLDSIIAFTTAHKIKLFLYTAPVYSDYSQKASIKRLQLIKEVVARNSSVYYTSYFTDTSFHADDFHDADHLDKAGAIKFSRKIDTALSQIIDDILRND